MWVFKCASIEMIESCALLGCGSRYTVIEYRVRVMESDFLISRFLYGFIVTLGSSQ